MPSSVDLTWTPEGHVTAPGGNLMGTKGFDRGSVPVVACRAWRPLAKPAKHPVTGETQELALAA